MKRICVLLLAVGFLSASTYALADAPPVDLHGKKGVVDPKDLKKHDPKPPTVKTKEPPPPPKKEAALRNAHEADGSLSFPDTLVDQTSLPTNANEGFGTPPGTAVGTKLPFYANWNCKGQSQCIKVMGDDVGSVGPFCDYDACINWKKNRFVGSCDQWHNRTVSSGPAPPGCWDANGGQ